MFEGNQRSPSTASRVNYIRHTIIRLITRRGGEKRRVAHGEKLLSSGVDYSIIENSRARRPKGLSAAAAPPRQRNAQIITRRPAMYGGAIVNAMVLGDRRRDPILVESGIKGRRRG